MITVPEEDIDRLNEDAFTVSGTCTPGEREVITVAVGTVTAPSNCQDNGTWIAIFDLSSLSSGTVEITATHTDGVGNGTAATPISIVRDDQQIVRIEPAAANINAANVGGYSLGGLCSEAGEDVTVDVGNQVTTAVSCQSDQSWMVDNFDVTAVGQANNVLITVGHGTGPGTTATVIKDTGIPATPGITPLANIDATNIAAYTVSGTCEAGATVTVTMAGREAHPTCSGGGTWTATFDLVGIIMTQMTVVAKQTDTAGNTSGDATANADVSRVTISPAATDINIATGSIYTLGGTCTHNGHGVTVTVEEKVHQVPSFVLVASGRPTLP